MAEENENAEAEEKSTEEEAPKKDSGSSKTKLIVIMAIFMVVLSITAMMTTIILTLNRDSQEPAKVAKVENKEEPQEEPEKEEKDDDGEKSYVDSGTPHFYKFMPTFVVNIPSKGRLRFLQVQVQVMSFDEKVIKNVEQFAPLIKNDLVHLFGKQKFESLLHHDSKERLRAEALKTVNNVMKQHTGEGGIEQVLFTSFITQ